jgi:hypothetical protein
VSLATCLWGVLVIVMGQTARHGLLVLLILVFRVLVVGLTRLKCRGL